MKTIKLNSNKGVTIPDVIIAMIILSLFVGVISSLFYQIVSHNNAIRYNAVAVNYAVKIAEDIDKMTYEEVVEEDLNESLQETYGYGDNIQIDIQVEKYSDEDASKKDLIKIVTITVQYEYMNSNQSYELKKLKIKEI